MSAELMKSKFVRHRSVRRSSVESIISEPIAWISFKYWFLLSLGHMPRYILIKKMILEFLWIFFVFVNMGPYGSKNLKTLLLSQITFESFQTFSEISSELSKQIKKYYFGFLKFWVYDFSRFFFLFC